MSLDLRCLESPCRAPVACAAFGYCRLRNFTMPDDRMVDKIAAARPHLTAVATMALEAEAFAQARASTGEWKMLIVTLKNKCDGGTFMVQIEGPPTWTAADVAGAAERDYNDCNRRAASQETAWEEIFWHEIISVAPTEPR